MITTLHDACDSSAWLLHVHQTASHNATTRLCGVLGLQAAMEEVVEALEEACGMGAPAAPGTLDESKQVSALATLLSIAGGPEGALLGAGWYRVLRVLSGLQAQQQGLLPQPAGGVLPASFDQPLAPYNARTLVGKARRSGLHAAVRAVHRVGACSMLVF